MVLYTTKDDTDASTFTFEASQHGNWTTLSDPQNYGGSSMQVWAIGTAVRVNFRGKAVVLFGTVDQGINVTASVDGGEPKTLFQFTSVKNYRQQLYNSSELEYGDHTLLVTQLFDHFPLIVDYAQIDVGETDISSTTASDTPPQVSPDTPVSDHASISSGGVAGIVVAIIIIVLGAILAAVLWRRRMRRRAKQSHLPPPTDLPLHTRPPVPDTTARGVPEKAQLTALWQASQQHLVQLNREMSPTVIPSSSTSDAEPGSSHISAPNHSSPLSLAQERTPPPKADADIASPSPITHSSPTSQRAPPPTTGTTIVTGSSIPASGWSLYQRSLSFAQNMEPPSPTGSNDSQGTFDSSDLDHAVPRKDPGPEPESEPELPPYPGPVKGSDT